MEVVARLGLGSGLALHTVLGSPLDPEADVGSQIADGAVLQLVEATGLDDLIVYDDVTEAVGGSASSPVHAGREARHAVNLAGSAILGGVVAGQCVGFDSWHEPRGHVALVVALLLAGLVTMVLPRLAMAWAGLSNGLEGSELQAAIPRGRSALVALTALLGCALAVLVPIGTAAGPAAALLAIDVALAYLLFSRPPQRARLAWFADGAEWLCRFLLVPLAAWAGGLLTSAQGWTPT